MAKKCRYLIFPVCLTSAITVSYVQRRFLRPAAQHRLRLRTLSPTTSAPPGRAAGDTRLYPGTHSLLVNHALTFEPPISLSLSLPACNQKYPTGYSTWPRTCSC